MTVEIRVADQNFVCDWGTFENSEADPRRGLHHLMVTTPDYAAKLLESGPRPGPRGGMHSVIRDGGRMFAHLDYEGERTTWELFGARWWDDADCPILVGRWPD